MFKMDDYICFMFMFSFGSAYHIFQKNTKYKTNVYTFLHICVSGFFGLHMCKWFFDLHILTHPYTSIHIHPYAFRYNIVVFLVHAFVQWHHMICFSILQNDCGPMDCISSCISCNELTRDKHVYWFKSAAHWIAYLYNSLVNQKMLGFMFHQGK